MNFHIKLVQLRKKKKWSQKMLGESIGVHTAHLSRLENGKSQPSVDMLLKLSKALGVTMDYLMDDALDNTNEVSVKNKKIEQQVKLIDELNKEDQETILNVIDSMLTKKKMLELLTLKQSAIN